MPYSNDPENIPSDRVRFLLGDTSTSPDLTDNEIAYLLTSEDDNVLRAAARGADQLFAKFTRTAEEKRVGPLSIRESTSSGKSKAERFALLARRLWAQANAGGLPFAGGISYADKASREQDTDRVRPSFTRRHQEYPLGTRNARLEGTQ